MTPLIRKTWWAPLALALALLAPLPAQARDLRHPETGVPAYTFVLPDDWTSEAAEQGNLLLFDASRAAVVVILVAASNEPLETIAGDAFKTAVATPSARPQEPAEISGRPGFTWFATLKDAKNDNMNLEMTIVRIDKDHVASASLILAAHVTPANEAAARRVRSGLALDTGAAGETSSLPEPVLALTGLEYYEAGGKEWTRYKYRVANLADYPNELFAPAPDLPPCGKNTNASRTWVDFFDETGKRLYGFCALGNRDQLNGIWFAVETTLAPPERVYIQMTDRKTDTLYKSNLAPTSKGPRRQ